MVNKNVFLSSQKQIVLSLTVVQTIFLVYFHSKEKQMSAVFNEPLPS